MSEQGSHVSWKTMAGVQVGVGFVMLAVLGHTNGFDFDFPNAFRNL